MITIIKNEVVLAKYYSIHNPTIRLVGVAIAITFADARPRLITQFCNTCFFRLLFKSKLDFNFFSNGARLT